MKVVEYLDLVHRYGHHKPGYRLEDPVFEKHFPKREVSRCPFCQEPLLYRLDTLSLVGLRCNRDSQQALGYIKNEDLSGFMYQRCQHLFLTDLFLNFNGRRPGPRRLEGGPDVNGYESEVPGIMPEYMAARRCDVDMQPLFFKNNVLPHWSQLYDFYWQRVEAMGEALPLIDIKAVISSFPVMRPTFRGFKPNYTAYLLVYYIGEDNERFTQYRSTYGDSAWQAVTWVHDRFPLGNRTFPENMFTATLDYNLLPYAERGQLLWWDETGLHSLQDRPVPRFPYRRRIHGRKKYFEIPDRKVWGSSAAEISKGDIDYGTMVRPRLRD